MRFAAQRFRSPNQSIGRFQAADGAEGDYRYRYQADGLPQSRAAMPDVSARSMAKTEEPDFNIFNPNEPEFRA